MVHIFTQDQESRRAAGGTYHEFYVDEPQPKGHYVEIARGLQKAHGKTVMTMTPLSEPWIFDDIYNQAGNLGGTRREIFAITAFPDENLKSKGGHLEDKAVEEYRASLSEEEREARVHGRWMHLLGRVFKTFDENVHGIDELPGGGPQSGTPGISVDPHDRLPFFVSWFYLTPSNDFVFYDCWPEEPFEDFTSSPINDYDEYLELFRRNPSFWRCMDPNYGQSPAPNSRGLTVAQEFQRRGMAFMTDISDDVTAGHKAIESLLSYNKDKEIDALNHPKLYIHRRCRNLITAFRNYTWEDWRGKTGEGKSPKQKPKEKFKHGIDTVRYPVMAGCRYVSTIGEAVRRFGKPRMEPGWLEVSQPRPLGAIGLVGKRLFSGNLRHER